MDGNGISIDPIDSQAHLCGKLNAIDTIPLTKHIFWGVIKNIIYYQS